MAHHEIRVELQGHKMKTHGLTASDLHLDDTVHCSSEDGVAEIYFDVNGTPFRNQNGSPKTEIDSTDPPLPLKATGTFSGRCYIIPPAGAPIGYDATGGDMVVK